MRSRLWFVRLGFADETDRRPSFASGNRAICWADRGVPIPVLPFLEMSRKRLRKRRERESLRLAATFPSATARVRLGRGDEDIRYLAPTSSDDLLGEISRLQAAGREAESIFNTLWPTVRKRVLEFNPLMLLAHGELAMIGNNTAYFHDAVIETPVQQHHLELSQALALMHQWSAFQVNHFDEDSANELLSSIGMASEALLGSRKSGIGEGSTEEALHLARIVEFMRLDTQAWRGWDYLDIVQELATGLFEPIDATLVERTGLSAMLLYELLTRLFHIIGDRADSFFKSFAVVTSSPSRSFIVDVARQYVRSGSMEESLESALASCHDGDIESIRRICLTALYFCIPMIFTLDSDALAQTLPTSPDPIHVKSVLCQLSLTFGDLANERPELFFLDSPIWRHPFIRLSESKFFWPIIQIYQSHLTTMLASLIGDNHEALSVYYTRRAKFLEDKIVEVVTESFPTNQIWKNILWRRDGRSELYETDVFIIYDTVAFIIEAKSAQAPASAGRGSPIGLSGAIKRLIVDPSLQSQRLEEHIRESKAALLVTQNRRDWFSIDISKVRTICRVNMTLESLGIVQSSSQLMRDSGLIRSDVKIAPSMSLASFITIMRMVEGKSNKVHYFTRRQALENSGRYLGEEKDILGHYLEWGFNGLWETEKTIDLFGRSEALDWYWRRGEHQRRVRRPQLKLTKRWRSMIAKLEEERTTGWLQISSALYDFDYERQKRFEIEFERLRRLAKRDPRGEAQDQCVVVKALRGDATIALLGLAFYPVDRDDRDGRIQAASTAIMAEFEVSDIIVVYSDLCNRDVPYCVAAYVTDGMTRGD